MMFVNSQHKVIIQLQIRIIIVTTFIISQKGVLFSWLKFHECLLSQVGLYYITEVKILKQA